MVQNRYKKRLKRVPYPFVEFSFKLAFHESKKDY